MADAPLRFAFAPHNHQPVGNFHDVLEEHVTEVYLPFLRLVAERELLPITLHLSGPLLDWLEKHGTGYLDLVGRLVADRRVELLLSGLYEPVLVALPRADRLEQIGWMRERLSQRFGVEARGLWLTERVWEPDLPADLVAAGVEYALLDDRHFLTAGLSRDALDRPFRTEADGKLLTVLPIDERLRYLIPFRPAGQTASFLRTQRSRGAALAVLADDGEKFGGWPGTREWVYEGGWLEDFISALQNLQAAGELELVTASQAASLPSGGLVYLPGSSYREMEEWALPMPQGAEFEALRHELGEERLAGRDGAFVRGGAWRGFLVKYAESNRMHKKMLALSSLSRERGDPPDARAAIGRSQCNDAYWHGVFGGIYLPHLRAAVWRELATAEGLLRTSEHLAAERLDLDGDGAEELWVHSSEFSALVAPARGGAIEEFTMFASGVNHADTLTRRREAYHGDAALDEIASAAEGGAGDGALPAARATRRTPVGIVSGALSIHELHSPLARPAPPGLDADTRAWLLERLLPIDLERADYERGDFEALESWTRTPMRSHVSGGGGRLTIVLEEERPDGLRKELTFSASGRLEVEFSWYPDRRPTDAVFSTELSISSPISIATDPPGEVWRHDIVTLARSERGFEEVTQGISWLLRWPISLGRARVRVDPRPTTPAPA